MKRSTIILIAVVFAIAAVVLANRPGKRAAGLITGTGQSQATSSPAAAQGPKKGSSAPLLELSALNGSATYQVGGKRDKVMILNFWASWCGPCDREAPDLKALYAQYKDQVDLYAVNATKYDTLRGAKDFVKEKELDFPVMTDARGNAGDAYMVFQYPTSFIIDRSGRITERIEGVISVKQWQKYLDAALQS